MSTLALGCCVQALSHYSKQGLLSLWGTAFSLQWFLLLQSTDSKHRLLSTWLSSRSSEALVRAQQLWHTDVSCSAARGIFLDQGSNWCLLHWKDLLYH